MLDNIMVIFFVTVGVLYAVGYLLWKAGLLKQALTTLLAVLLLGSIAIASGHAEEIDVVVVNAYSVEAVLINNEPLLLITFNYKGYELSFYWEDELDIRPLRISIFNSVEVIDAEYDEGE